MPGLPIACRKRGQALAARWAPPPPHLPVLVAVRHLRVALDHVDHQAQPLEPVTCSKQGGQAGSNA